MYKKRKFLKIFRETTVIITGIIIILVLYYCTTRVIILFGSSIQFFIRINSEQSKISMLAFTLLWHLV